MQSITLLNMLESAKRRQSAQLAVLSETTAQHDEAVKRGMVQTAKKLRANLKRQQQAVTETTTEIQEIELQVKRDGDLLTPDGGQKRK